MNSPAPRRSLRANFAWQLVANLLGAGVQLATSLLLSKQGADAVTGQYGVALTLSTPIFMFATLDIRVFQATDARREFAFSEYLAARFLSGSVAWLFLMTVALCWGYSDAVLHVTALVGASKFVELLADTFYGAMQRCDRLDLVSRASVIRTLLSCATFVAVMLGTRDLPTALTLTALMSVLITLAVDWPMSRPFLSSPDTDTRWWREAIHGSSLRRLMRHGVPLGFRLFLVSLIPNISRFFLERFHGLAMFGIFLPISQASTIAPLFSRSMNHAVAPRLAQYAAANDLPRFRRLLFQVRVLYAIGGVLMVLAVIAIGKPLLAIATRPEIAEYHSAFVAVMIATAIQSQGGVLDLALVTLRKSQALVPATGVTIGAMCVTCWLLIPTHGMHGAAAAISVSCIIREIWLQLAINAVYRSLEQKTSESPASAERRAA